MAHANDSMPTLIPIEPVLVYGDVTSSGRSGAEVAIVDCGVLPPPGTYVCEADVRGQRAVVRVEVPPRLECDRPGHVRSLELRGRVADLRLRERVAIEFCAVLTTERPPPASEGACEHRSVRWPAA